MTHQSDGQTIEQKIAAERIEEARQLYRSINQTLKVILELVEAGDLSEIALLPKQMAQLTAAIAESQKREAEFNGRNSEAPEAEEIDFNALRRQIGCRLGRIRRCCQS